MPFLLVLRARRVEAAAAPAIRDCRAPPSGEWARVEPWRPWPAHPPFADEITRWWPSDDWPPDKPAVVIEDTIPNVPPAVIDWRAAGGLLDFWA